MKIDNLSIISSGGKICGINEMKMGTRSYSEYSAFCYHCDWSVGLSFFNAGETSIHITSRKQANEYLKEHKKTEEHKENIKKYRNGNSYLRRK